jgi:hypothetical protein
MNFERKKKQILSGVKCFICNRELTCTELFLNKNVCFVCKLKNIRNRNNVKTTPEK